MKRRLLILVVLSGLFSNVDAEPTIGRLSIETTPPGQLFIDGQPMGKTPKKNLKLTPGNHAIRLKRNDKTEYQFEIKIQAGVNLRCSHDFDKGQTECGEAASGGLSAKDKKGYLKLTSEPNTDVYLDGKRIGKSPIDKHEVKPGHYIIEFRYPNYDSVTKDVEVQEDQTVTVEASFPTQKPQE